MIGKGEIEATVAGHGRQATEGLGGELGAGAVEGIDGAGVADAVRIQYGGSVKPDNAEELLGKENIDGALVGGAALKAGDFAAIVKAAR